MWRRRSSEANPSAPEETRVEARSETAPEAAEAQEQTRSTPVGDGRVTGSGDPVLREAVVEALKTVYDPEIPVDIYELGLIYEVTVRQESDVYVKMTLTTPHCPAAELLPPEIEAKVRSVAGVSDVELELVWDPPWSPQFMSEAARLELNL